MMTLTYLKKHVKKSKTVFNKSFDLHQQCLKNFGPEADVTRYADAASWNACRTFQTLKFQLDQRQGFSPNPQDYIL